MNYTNMNKRILSLVLAVAMLVSFLPAVQWVVEAEASEIATVASDRSTKYLSSSTGGSAYLGYGNSANKPEKVSASNLPSKIKSYLSQGYNVMLKRGDDIFCGPMKERTIKEAINSRLGVNGVSGTIEAECLNDMLELYDQILVLRKKVFG